MTEAADRFGHARAYRARQRYLPGLASTGSQGLVGAAARRLPGWRGRASRSGHVPAVRDSLSMPSQTLFRFVLPSIRADSPRAR